HPRSQNKLSPLAEASASGDSLFWLLGWFRLSYGVLGTELSPPLGRPASRAGCGDLIGGHLSAY
ncbi:MAG: hypothetical protein SOW66_02760, partial [Porphyromonas sp.]|nr:hypothetical protein [Porphyromonas sp.]